MKKYKILTGLMAAAVLSGASAMAQFNYQNGDMLAFFGKAGATSDVVVDLGSIANFQLNDSSIQTWNLAAAFTTAFGSSSATGLYWSLLGANDTSGPTGTYNTAVTQADPYTVWATSSTRPHVVGNSATQQGASGDIINLGQLTTPNQAGAGQIVDFAPGIELVNPTIGFSSEMSVASGFNGTLNGDLTFNALHNAAGSVGLYQSDPGNHKTSLATLIGVASLDPSSGVLTVQATPEPSTWAMLGSGMLALLALRRRK